ncbi:MAG TPA: NAD(P)-dependent oxidoreductase [Candidatus Saccharimonadales bacterium]|nr:NAD(P)-dependent oxidoreductase [Candidatus Saccharimonadales bacterium]
MVKQIAVIGLGIMGHGIADNFLKNGYKVTVWNRTPEKADDLVAKGAVLASSIKEAIESADLVFEVTANDESSKAVWEGETGILANAKPAQSLITCATLSVQWTDELAAQCQQLGLTFFDMAMTGGRAGAEAGELILLVGGDQAKLDDLKPELSAIAKELKYFGKAGSGMRFKLILNALQAVHIAALGEALKLAKRVGLDEKLVGDALAERPGGTTTNLAWRDYQTDPQPINFSVEWIAKDLGYAKDMATSVEHPLIDIAEAIYRQAIDQGYGQSDWTKINKL